MKNSKEVLINKPVVNSLNYNHNHYVEEDKYPTSLTIPDQSLTMRQLLDFHSRGINLTNTQQAFFHDFEQGEQQGINIKNLDLVDIQRLKMENADKIFKMQEHLTKAQKIKLEAEKQAEKQRIIDEHIASQKEKINTNSLD